jgi:hypothetical protein
MRFEKISDSSDLTHEERIAELEDKVNILTDAVEHLHENRERLRREMIDGATKNKVQ